MKPITMNKIVGMDCIYCGESAECRDHVIPFCYNNSTGKRKEIDYHSENVVPACNECNGYLGSQFITNIAERALYLANRLKIKNKKLLKTPDWSKEELEDLSANMRNTIQALQFKKGLLKDKISHMQNMSYNHTLAPKDYWEIMDECER